MGKRCLSVFFFPAISCLLLAFPLWTSSSGHIPQLYSLTPLGPPHRDADEKQINDVSLASTHLPDSTFNFSFLSLPKGKEITSSSALSVKGTPGPSL